MCVVSHKFREGMEVEERLGNMEDKLDDIYEEVVGEERIKTGKYVSYDERLNEYDERLNVILTKKGDNKYHLSSMGEFNYNLELLSDNSLFGKSVSTKETTVVTFGKGEYLFVWEKVLYVHEDYKRKFLEEMDKVNSDEDGEWYKHFFHTRLIDSDAIKRQEDELEKG